LHGRELGVCLVLRAVAANGGHLPEGAAADEEIDDRRYG
jgi:hypothetical protein